MENPEENIPRRSSISDNGCDDTIVYIPNPRSPWYKRMWTKKPDTDPRAMSYLRKTIIVFIVSIAGSTSPFVATIYYPALVPMQEYFQTNDTAMNASLAIYIFFIAFFPLIWATFADIYGRRPIYLASFMIAVVGSVCCAVSVNIGMFIAFRALSAIGSSSVLSLGAATISDIFESHERGRAFSYYMAGPLSGTALGPILGGFLNQDLGWRSIFWFVAVANFCVWLSILLFLPETRYTDPSSVTASSVGAEQEQKKRKLVNPLASLELMRHSNISLAVAFLGILFMVNYIVNTNFTRIYTVQYGFDSGIVGLCYLPIAIGNVVGGMLAGQASDRLYMKRAARSSTGHGYPEMRLGGFVWYSAIIIALLGFTAYGWCVQYNVHYSAGLAILFFGNILHRNTMLYSMTDKLLDSWSFIGRSKYYYVNVLG
ncbi:major facilitator superfamily domain-containing protein [Fennellomyces sp. T-0311]|nr:major facilitator superfamily domain-containing protein [Fennellomyces sp. T-0311]